MHVYGMISAQGAKHRYTYGIRLENGAPLLAVVHFIYIRVPVG